MILQQKHALVFAATGAIGSAVACRFAQEGAHVWISGRDHERLALLEKEIVASGGRATAEVVDATDADAVDAYVHEVATASQIHIVFNAIGGRPVDLGYPRPSTTQSLEKFLLPIQTIVGSQFLTARAAAREMMAHGAGAVVTLSATLSAITAPNMAGITAACGAVEAMTLSLAGEFGASGVRVNCVRSGGLPETRTIREVSAAMTQLTGQAAGPGSTPLGRPITLAETASTAAFLASDLASGMTGQVVTVSAGANVG